MNYNIRRIDRNTARIVFEYNNSQFSSKFLQIWRLRKMQDGQISRAKGIVLGQDARQTLALISKVSHGDTLVIFQKMPKNNLGFLYIFKISKTLEPIAGRVEKLREVGAALMFDQIKIDDDTCSSIEDRDLKVLLRNRTPEWIRSIIDAQLDYWRERNPRRFLNVAPQNRVSENLQLLVYLDPERSLSEFQAMLSRTQLLTCIRKSPSAGMRFAFESVPRKLRKLHLIAHADYLVENHLKLLTNSELRACATASPKKAFLARGKMPPRQQAIIVAHTYGVVWHTLLGKSRSDFRGEAIESMTQFPEEWLCGRKDGFQEIFRKLRNLLGIVLEPCEIGKLFDEMSPQGRSELVKYISIHV